MWLFDNTTKYRTYSGQINTHVMIERTSYIGNLSIFPRHEFLEHLDPVGKSGIDSHVNSERPINTQKCCLTLNLQARLSWNTRVKHRPY